MTDVRTIDVLDRGRTGSIAVYLLEGSAGPVLVETGPGVTFPTLRTALERRGHRMEDVRDAVVTHIHFDHAGAVGHLARHGTRIHVHEFGAPHLVEPGKLVASARRIYGDEMDRRWGEIVPVPAAQLCPVRDGDVLRFGDVELKAIETPGHARHHLTLRMEAAEGPVGFVGDAAASYVAAKDFIALPAPPPEFSLEQWLGSLERLERERFTSIYLTHFGRVDDPGVFLQRVRDELIAHTDFVRALFEQGAPDGEIHARYHRFVDEQVVAAGLTDVERLCFVSETIISMSVTGILRALRKAAEAAAAST